MIYSINEAMKLSNYFDSSIQESIEAFDIVKEETNNFIKVCNAVQCLTENGIILNEMERVAKDAPTASGRVRYYIKTFVKKIKELCEKVIKFIKDTFGKIKAFFTNERAKKAESNVNELIKKNQEANEALNNACQRVEGIKIDLNDARAQVNEKNEQYSELHAKWTTLQRAYKDMKFEDNEKIEAVKKELEETKVAQVASIMNKLRSSDIMYYDYTAHIDTKNAFAHNGGGEKMISSIFGFWLENMEDDTKRKEYIQRFIFKARIEANCISKEDYNAIVNDANKLGKDIADRDKKEYTNKTEGSDEFLAWSAFDSYMIHYLINKQIKEKKESIKSDEEFLKWIKSKRWIFYSTQSASALKYFTDQIAEIKEFDYEKELLKYNATTEFISEVGKILGELLNIYRDNCTALAVNIRYAARQAEAVNIAMALLEDKDPNERL